MATSNIEHVGHSRDRGRAEHQSAPHGQLLIGCVGVVYGDIGTSPLYAFREAVTHARDSGIPDTQAVLGVLSLIFWTLGLIVSLKYVLVLLRADNKGEGGVFALMSLAQSVSARGSTPILLGLGIAGASFFFGDAVLTPAISVLSAVEGLKLIEPRLEWFIVPVTILILMGLFGAQSRGTQRVAKVFGPIMLVWFIALAVGGLIHILDDPRVFYALNPLHGLNLAMTNGFIGLSIMGFVFLAVTGAEALYTDLGHFGRKPIQLAWFWLVFPALLLNYLGQGALVLANPAAIANPLYKLYPGWALYPMILLATLATVIASQAVITGAFSIANQATQLGFLPRLAVRHTSESVAGQIYLPRVNMLLFVATLIVVIQFRSSSALASAYGVSVTAAMVVDSFIAIFVIWKLWRWPLWKACALMVPLLIIEQIFFTSNIMKVLEGGWLPVMIAGAISLVMVTWWRGANILTRYSHRHRTELDWLQRRLEAKPPHRVPGTAVFLTADPEAAPIALMHNLKHNRVLHERNIILSIKTVDVPRVPRHERLTINRESDHFIRVVAQYGFMETPNVPNILERCKRKDLNIELGSSSFFLSRRSLKLSEKSEMPRWQDRLFIWLVGTSEDATEYFRIPHDRVVEVGTQVIV